MKTTLAQLNAADLARFVQVCGPLFEHSPWIAERTWSRRPFASLSALHLALCMTVGQTSEEEQLALISAHPDLVGRAAMAGELTSESAREQATAGLGSLMPEEVRQFQGYNAAYQQKFGFPFIICACENKKEAILAAFPARLKNPRDQEIATALSQISKIAWLRLVDAVAEA